MTRLRSALGLRRGLAAALGLAFGIGMFAGTQETLAAPKDGGAGGTGCVSLGGYWMYRRNPGDNVSERCWVEVTECECGSTIFGPKYCEYHTIQHCVATGMVRY